MWMQVQCHLSEFLMQVDLWELLHFLAWTQVVKLDSDREENCLVDWTSESVVHLSPLSSSAFQLLFPRATATLNCAITDVTPYWPPRVHLLTHSPAPVTHHPTENATMLGLVLSKPPPHIMDHLLLFVFLVLQSRHVYNFPVWQGSFLSGSQGDSASAVTSDPGVDLPGARSGGLMSESVVYVRRAYRRDIKLREAKVPFLLYGRDYHHVMLSKK